ncbi:hypothetical protein GJ496_000627 [Pomphorhynchus laevis]|nr:hypothetical protein GJ496_000627 [Pomphorhynchus laevis]
MTIELVRQGNYGKAMERISSSRLAPFTEQTHRKLTDLHPPGKGIITSIPTAEHVDSVTGIGLNKCYLDDGIIGGEPKAVDITLNMIANELEQIGLSMN